MLLVLVAMEGVLPWIRVVSIGCYGLMRYLGYVLLVLVTMEDSLPWIRVVVGRGSPVVGPLEAVESVSLVEVGLVLHLLPLLLRHPTKLQPLKHKPRNSAIKIHTQYIHFTRRKNQFWRSSVFLKFIFSTSKLLDDAIAIKSASRLVVAGADPCPDPCLPHQSQ